MPTHRIVADSANLITALGATPGGNDTVRINRYFRDFSAGTDLSAADLAAIIFEPGFGGRFRNSDGGELVAVVNQTGSGYVQNNSSSPRIELRSTSSAGVIARIEHAPARGDGQLQIGACDCERLDVHGGLCVALQGMDLAACAVSGGQCVLRSSSYAITTLEANGGEIEIERDVTTLHLNAGATLTSTHSDFSPTTMNHNGGNWIVKQSGTVSTYNGRGGLIDLTQAERLPVFSAGEIGPGVTIRLAAGQEKPSLSGLTLRMGGPRYEYV